MTDKKDLNQGSRSTQVHAAGAVMNKKTVENEVREVRKSTYHKWSAAIERYQASQPDMLARLLNSDEPIPQYARRALAEIVSGNIKPEKGKKRQKIFTAEQGSIQWAAARLIINDEDGTREKGRTISNIAEMTGVSRERGRRVMDREIRRLKAPKLPGRIHRLK